VSHLIFLQSSRLLILSKYHGNFRKQPCKNHHFQPHFVWNKHPRVIIFLNVCSWDGSLRSPTFIVIRWYCSRWMNNLEKPQDNVVFGQISWSFRLGEDRVFKLSRGRHARLEGHGGIHRQIRYAAEDLAMRTIFLPSRRTLQLLSHLPTLCQYSWSETV
jgi:hypothetical protein